MKENSDLYRIQQLTGQMFTFDGVMGMSNIDQSSGNTILKQFKDKGVLESFNFGILLGPYKN